MAMKMTTTDNCFQFSEKIYRNLVLCVAANFKYRLALILMSTISDFTVKVDFVSFLKN